MKKIDYEREAMISCDGFDVIETPIGYVMRCKVTGKDVPLIGKNKSQALRQAMRILYCEEIYGIDGLDDAVKLEILNEHVPYTGFEWKTLDEVRYCTHCGKRFTGHEVRFKRHQYRYPGQTLPICPTRRKDGEYCMSSPGFWWKGRNKHPLIGGAQLTSYWSEERPE